MMEGVGVDLVAVILEDDDRLSFRNMMMMIVLTNISMRTRTMIASMIPTTVTDIIKGLR